MVQKGDKLDRHRGIGVTKYTDNTINNTITVEVDKPWQILTTIDTPN